jgi:hypothetical protein
MRMKTRSVVWPVVPVVAVMVGAGLEIVPAKAKSAPSFSSVSAAAGYQHDVTVTFTETGLASGQNVTERLRAKATDTYACYTATGDRAGSAALVEHRSNEQHYQAGTDGSIEAASLSAAVGPLDVCPNGETSYLYKTVFSHLRLTDRTNTVSHKVPGNFTSCSPPDCQPPEHL